MRAPYYILFKLLCATFLLTLSLDCKGQFERSWKSSILGGWNGASGIIIQDIDGDGDDEIVSTAVIPNSALTNYWYTLDGGNDSLGMGQTYVSDLTLHNTQTIEYALHGEQQYILQGIRKQRGSREGDLELRIVDLLDKEIIKVEQLENVLEIFTHDYDKDFIDDLIVLGVNEMTVFSIPQLEVKESFTGRVIKSFYPEMLDIDADGRDELISTSRNSFVLINLEEGRLETTWDMNDYSHLGTSYDIDFYDYDDDGDLEIYMLTDQHIRVFDPSTKTEIASIFLGNLSEELFNEEVADKFVIGSIFDEGEDYIIYKSLEHLLFVDPKTLQLVKYFEDNYGSGWTRNLWDIWLGDTDGDGFKEAIWTNGKGQSVPISTHLYIQDLRDKDNFWVSPRESFDLFDFKIAKSPETKNPTLYLKRTTKFRDVPKLSFMTEFDLINKRFKHYKESVPFRTFDIIESDGDEGLEILVNNSKQLYPSEQLQV